jgi:GxxExxY protein
VDSALKVHQALGPGLLESAYQRCMMHELGKRGLAVACEMPLSIRYDGILIEAAYRMDMLVEDQVVIENKMVDRILPIHEAQLLAYLKLSGRQLGFLLNWNVALMKQGIRRMVHNLADNGGPRRRSEREGALK